MKESKEYYNILSEHYDSETKSRLKYLNKIDGYVVEKCNNKVVQHYLDVGSGDGRRSLKIAKNVVVKGLIYLVDNSEKMLDKTNLNEKVSVLNISVDELNSDIKFDLITCLWNVLGHFPNKKSRVDFFKKIESLLSDDGAFIFDVNNRYNIAQYGKENVANNIKSDALNTENSGWYTLGKKPNQTKVYIHSPFDIYDYIESTNLVVDETRYINYDSGFEVNTFFEGQLLYKISKQANSKS